jgi:dephospho-CoA kinase
MNQLKIQRINSGKYVLGITGSMGCGKSYACRKLKRISKMEGINVHEFSEDYVRRKILSNHSSYAHIRQGITRLFGEGILNEDGSINRGSLSDIVFYNADNMKSYKSLVMPAIKEKLQEKIQENYGLMLFESGLLVEDNLLDFVDKVLLVKCDYDTQLKRLFGPKCDLPVDNILKRINKFQLSNDEKEKRLRQSGKELFVFDSSQNPCDLQYLNLLEEIIK